MRLKIGDRENRGQRKRRGQALHLIWIVRPDPLRPLSHGDHVHLNTGLSTRFNQYILRLRFQQRSRDKRI